MFAGSFMRTGDQCRWWGSQWCAASAAVERNKEVGNFV